MKTTEKLVAVTAAGAAAAGASQAVADSSNFTGSFAGVGLGTLAPHWNDSYNYGNTNQGINLFAGHNWALDDSPVAGFDVGVWASNFSPDSYYGMGNLTEIRFKLGTAIDNTMLYGAVGVWDGVHSWYDAGTAQGASVALGMEQNFGPDMFGAIDYTHRITTYDDGSASKELVGTGTIAVKAGFRLGRN